MAAAGFAAYRFFVLAYALVLPIYFGHRFVYSIAPPETAIGYYQWVTCMLELYGALNVLLLGFIRFRMPWADAAPKPPSVLPEDDADEEQGILSLPSRGDERGPYDVVRAQDIPTRSVQLTVAHGSFRGAQAIMIPCYSEPDDVIFGTIAAALSLHDPLASRVRVVLCDDGDRPARKARLEQLPHAERAIYVSRPKLPNVPRHGKAGNLNYALSQVLYPVRARAPRSALDLPPPAPPPPPPLLRRCCSSVLTRLRRRLVLVGRAARRSARRRATLS
jgi:hypothetical protein